MNENNQKYAYSDEQAHSFDTPAHDPYNYESNWYASQDRPQESKMPVHRAALLGVLAAVVVILIGFTVFLLLNDRQRNRNVLLKMFMKRRIWLIMLLNKVCKDI